VDSSRVPFSHLEREEWERLADAAALFAWLLVLGVMAWAAFSLFGEDFRGYYAAATVWLHGGDPYDYAQLVPVLKDITGYVGNNPYYYPPWFVIFMTPFATLPYQTARAVWIVLNVALLWSGAELTLRALAWPVTGWQRWSLFIAGGYLFGWMCLRFEQTGILIFFFFAAALYLLKTDRPLVAGVAMSLLLTKPQAGYAALALLLIFAWHRYRRTVTSCLLALIVLLGTSTVLVPGWYRHVLRADFGAGLFRELNGPGQVVAQRINTTLLDWLASFGMTGAAAWFLYALVFLICASALGYAYHWQTSRDWTYLAGLGVVLGFLVVPYSLQYDYPPMLVSLFWLFRRLGSLAGFRRWGTVGLLAGAFSVPLWERPISDGFWIPLALALALLLALPQRGERGKQSSSHSDLISPRSGDKGLADFLRKGM